MFQSARRSAYTPPHLAHRSASAVMPPSRCSSSGYRGVRAHLNGKFYAEIRSREERIGLDMFEMAHEAAHAYGAVVWRLGHSRRSVNFSDVWMRQQVEDLAPPPQAITQEARQWQRELEWHLLVTERDKRMHLEWAWCFPEDVTTEVAFYAEKEEQK
ncbi:uncharacterized protein [Lolium perenne]|uniref:uncharacterized protein n=1 Tax=Lolium perenne TaxID=4522 RepID=UPI0021F5CC6B|nr:ethylene-responsive transcription factor 1-like [Lolium perenne]